MAAAVRSMMVPLIIAAFAVSSCSRMPAYGKAPLNGGGDVAISVGSIREKVPKFYSFDLGGQRIDFFVVRVNGQIQSYFDACAMCYPKKLGYRVEGGEIVCRACNLTYTAGDLKTGKGSCHPIPLDGRVENGFYIITRDAISAGSKYF